MNDPTPGAPPTATAPGSPEALDHGCHCSFLLNDPAQDAFVNPLCPLHGAPDEGRVNAS